MLKFVLDTIGYIHDHVPRWAKLTAVVLILLSVGFFFGYRAAIYVAGGALWFATGALIVTHVIILIGNLRKKRETTQVPLTPADQADIAEFQAAMQGTDLQQAPAHQQPYQPPLEQQTSTDASAPPAELPPA